MNVRLVIEHAPHGQRETSRTWEGGELVIGRGDDAGWQIDDPDMFLSRRHCVISEIDGTPHVTDASRGGLFVDGASEPLGAGNSCALQNGMRLRLGDFVLRVEMDGGATNVARPERRPTMSFEFGSSGEAPKDPPKRPDNLPDPFGLSGSGGHAAKRPEPARPPRPLDQDDPFALDLKAQPPRQTPPPRSPSSGGYFDDPPPRQPAEDRRTERPAPTSPFAGDPFGPLDHPASPEASPPGQSERSESGTEWAGPRLSDPFSSESPAPEKRGSDWGGPRAPSPAARPPAEDQDRGETDWAGPRFGDPESGPARAPPPAPAPPPAAAPARSGDLRAAFLRGAGLDPARFVSEDPEREMEEMGARFRALVDGVMHLLRTRALEKQQVRVAQTVISSADVNPLKFLATTDDALGALVEERGAGYLGPKEAIDGAFRDLADHHVRTWTALQQAMRRMIDRFDPAEIEAEMEEAGRLKALLAGGRSALLWQLYEERYKEIARSAEERFLGEVGADFRDAYEGHRREKP